MMAIVLGILFVLEAIVALLMVAVVMLQPPKDPSGGMGSAFGGGFGEEVFGGRTGNVLSRATVVLGVLLILNTLGIAMIMSGGGTGTSLADRQEAPAPAAPEPALPANSPLSDVAPTPAQGAGQTP